MCGIFALLNNIDSYSSETVTNAFKTGSKRGPDKSTFTPSENIILGFHRLAINGLDAKSNQPFDMDDIMLICNGEIYNYKELYKTFDITPTTNSDCEIIIHLYKKFGILETIQMLDGVFAFCLYDKINNTIVVARDPFGVRPLYKATNTVNDTIAFSSTLRSITDIEIDNWDISQFTPGTYEVYNFSHNNWEYKSSSQYYNVNTNNSTDMISLHQAIYMINVSLHQAVKKRVFTCDRDIACLLSGGLDSSLITSLVNKYYKEKTGKTVKTFSIGMIGSEDLKYAKTVADFLDTDHTEICLTEQDFLGAIDNVIMNVETYDTTTVRASVGNYLVSKYISEHCDAKVIFNGDGSDEVTGGYLYFHCAPNHIEFDLECKRLLNNIHFFDVLRSDRTISSNGLEARTLSR